MEWININEQPPPQNVKIKIKAQAHYDDSMHEAEAVLKIDDIDEKYESWSWTVNHKEFPDWGTLLVLWIIYFIN